MRWTASGFCEDIFLRYRIKLSGWPADIPFKNLSKGASPSASHINRLLGLRQAKHLVFEKATDDEVAAVLLDFRKACPGVLFPPPSPNIGRSDIGRRRCLPADGKPPRYKRNGPKSAKQIYDDEEESGDRSSGRKEVPLTMVKNGVCFVYHKGVMRPLAQGELPEDPISDCD